MATLEYKEKLLGVTDVDKVRKIVISHVTIRQSISFLVLKLLVIEALAAVSIIIFHSVLLKTNIKEIIGEDLLIFNIPLFIILVLIKSFFTIFIIIQWLNEYYEITTKEVVYRKGLIFKKEDRHLFEHIGSVKLEQGIFGRIFNFGTIRLFNWTREKNMYMYLIHNPSKYINILEELLPEADKEKKVFREHVLEPEEDTL